MQPNLYSTYHTRYYKETPDNLTAICKAAVSEESATAY